MNKIIILLISLCIYGNSFSILETREDIDAKQAYQTLLEEIESGPKNSDNYISVALPKNLIEQFKQAKKAQEGRDQSWQPKKKTVVSFCTANGFPPLTLFFDRYITDLGQYFKTQEDKDAEVAHKDMMNTIECYNTKTDLKDNNYIVVKLSTTDSCIQAQQKQEERNAHWMPKRRTIVVGLAGAVFLKLAVEKLFS